MVKKILFGTVALVTGLTLSVNVIGAEKHGIPSVGQGTMMYHQNLISKTAKLKGAEGSKPSDIAGWDYVMHDVYYNKCYTYYVPQAPLAGPTQPQEIKCPSGMWPFNYYRVTYAEAIAIMHTADCGSEFVSMTLSWPVTSPTSEPLWQIITELGSQLNIGANSGYVYQCEPPQPTTTSSGMPPVGQGTMMFYQNLMSKTAKLKGAEGDKPSDVVGWDYVIYDGFSNKCYTYYVAQPPLHGMTQAQVMECPSDMRPFDHYRVIYAEAIAIMQSMNCGSKFVSMSLSWPTAPVTSEPLWQMTTELGSQLNIGANSGHVYQCNSQPSGATSSGTTNMANPASKYCVDLGYQLENGVCVFPDGSQCEEWAFFRGECGQQFSYCEKHGGKMENRVEGAGMVGYGLCKFPDGTECGEIAYVEGTCKPGECKQWTITNGCEK